MIFVFHKVEEGHDRDVNWISPAKFEKFLDTHKCFVSLDEYLHNGRKGNVITFDGIYENVYKNAAPMLHKRKIPFELFVMFGFIGKDNAFDLSQPLTTFCDVAQLRGLQAMGGEIQHHTWHHTDLTKLDYFQLDMELEKHKQFPTEYFAYPYGKFNRDVREVVKKRGFKGAVSVLDGDDSKYELIRRFYK